MANDYLQYSFLLPFSGVAAEDAAQYLQYWMDAKAMAMDEDNWGEITDDNWDTMYNMNVEIDGEAFWIYSEEFGSPEAAALFVYNFLVKFNIDGKIFFTWAETCSKMRLEHFSGGGCMVTKKGYDFWIPGDFKARYDTLN